MNKKKLIIAVAIVVLICGIIAVIGAHNKANTEEQTTTTTEQTTQTTEKQTTTEKATTTTTEKETETTTQKITQLETEPQKAIKKVAEEVINGVWGAGEERRNKLEKAGYDFEEVQAEVNKIEVQRKPTISYTNAPVVTQKPVSSNNTTTTQKPAATKPSGDTGIADLSTGIGWDGKPIVYHYADGTTGTKPQEGARYEIEEGLWGVVGALTEVDYKGLCPGGCGRKENDCDNRLCDWYCEVCKKTVKEFECHPLHDIYK